MAQTDRFYNAPEGPQAQPDVETPRRARYDLATSPAMFGGLIAQGLTEVGKGATEAYNAYGQVAADQANNGYLSDLSNLRTSVLNTKGQEAIDAVRGKGGEPGAADQSEALYQKWRATVPPGHQNTFDTTARRFQFYTNSQFQSHLSQQSGEWAKTVATNQETQAVNGVSSQWQDDAAFEANRDQLAGAAVKQLQAQQGIPQYASASPEQQAILRDTYSTANGKAWYYRIEAARAAGNNAQALQWQKDHADDLGKLGPEVQRQMHSYEAAQDIDASVNQKYAEAGSGPKVASAPHDNAYYSNIPKPADGVYAKIPAVGAHGENQLARFQQWNPDPVGNSAANLSTVHPDLQAIVRKAQSDNPNLPFVVALGKSTPAQEALATSWGWGEAGTGGNHHLNGDVVDLWPLDNQGHVVFDKGQQDKIAGAMKKAAGELGLDVRWGGLASEGGQNKNFRDAPNFQLVNPKPEGEPVTSSASFTRASPRVQSAVLTAGAAGVSVPPQYAPMIQSAGQKWNVDQAMLARQIQQESGFRDVTSPAGAQGISQFIHGTAARYGVNVHDPQSSIEGQAHYMHDLLGMFGNNKGLALAGYNWGEYNVQKWLQAGADPARMPRETANYVQSITGHPVSEWLQNPGIPIRTVPLGPGQVNPPIAEPSPIIPEITQTAPVTPFTPASIEVQPITPGAPAPEEGAQVQQAGYQQVSREGIGGALGGAPPVQQSGMETAPEQQSAWDIVRDRTSAAMMATMSDPNIPEDKKDKMLAKMERDLRNATFGAEQDAATRTRHSQEAIDRAFGIAMGGNGQPPNPQGGFNALDDAFQRGLIDEQKYYTAQTVIEKRTGAEDLRSYGPGYHNALMGVLAAPGQPNRVHDISDLLNMEAAEQITSKGYEKLRQDFNDVQKGDNESYLTQKKFAFDAAAKYLDWEMEGPTPGTSVRNPKGAAMMQDFANMFEGEAKEYRKDHPDMQGFRFFDSKKLQPELEKIYNGYGTKKDVDQGTTGLSKPALQQQDLAWKMADHPPAPTGADPDQWRMTIANSAPKLATGQTQGEPMAHAAFDLVLRTLFADPTPALRQDFNQRYGPDGRIARGDSAEDLLSRVRGETGVQREPTPPKVAPAAPIGGAEIPYVAPGYVPPSAPAQPFSIETPNGR